MVADPLTQLAFSIYENRGVYALLVGSGLSRAAEVPTGWDITKDLIRRVALSRGEGEQTDWVSWYLKETGKDPDYSELVEELGRTPSERRSILESYIGPSEDDREEGRKIPTPAHYAIAELVAQKFIRVIVTTNFDRLIESALDQRGIKPTVVASVDALRGAEPLIHSSCYLFKLHGDYKDSRILNTDAELTAYPEKYNALLDRIFDEHGIIVCGWSGEWDDALRAALLRCPSRRYSTFWAVRGEPSERAREIISHRDAHILSIADADVFFSSLRDRMETLVACQFQNPRSVELMVNSTKRFLSKPEYRIQLDDLIASEVRSLRDKLEEAGLEPHAEVTGGAFQQRIGIYEAASESLARMFGALGRWGSGSEFSSVLDATLTLWDWAESSKSGKVVWLNLRSYPPVLLINAYGIGLLRAERLESLHQLLTAPIEANDGSSLGRIVDVLFLQYWSGGKTEVWRMVEGFDRRRTPLSDHLLEILKPWSESFVGIVADFEELFETWEVLGSLSHGEIYSLEQIHTASSLENPNSSFVYSPAGRSGWHAQTRERILNRIQGNSFKAKVDSLWFWQGRPGAIRQPYSEFSAYIGTYGVVVLRHKWERTQTSGLDANVIGNGHRTTSITFFVFLIVLDL